MKDNLTIDLKDLKIDNYIRFRVAMEIIKADWKITTFENITGVNICYNWEEVCINWDIKHFAFSPGGSPSLWFNYFKIDLQGSSLFFHFYDDKDRLFESFSTNLN